MYQDMSHDRPTEVDYINGYLVELGRKYRYEAKTHAFLTHLVHLAEHTRQQNLQAKTQTKSSAVTEA
jgi:2-dehydropantoate 2-reductase